MRIGLCEDDKAARDYEGILIHKWADKKNLKITVDCYSSAENFLFESEDKIEYDFLLLDIQMGKMNGFELAKKLRSRGFDGSLAFLTGIIDFAVEGYEVGAVRYILKPIKEDSLFQTLDLVYADYSSKNTSCFILQIGTDISKIPFEQILYLEADGHYVHILYEKNGKYFENKWKGTFSEISRSFDEKTFFCLRRGLIVNLLHVKKITKTECVLSNDEVFPVARNNYENLNRAFIDFYREKAL